MAESWTFLRRAYSAVCGRINNRGKYQQILYCDIENKDWAWQKHKNADINAELTRDSFDTLSPTLASNSKRLLSASLAFSSAVKKEKNNEEPKQKH